MDSDALARQLTALTHATIVQWCAHPRPAQDYLSDLANGPGAMLRGALCGTELHKLERYIMARELLSN